MKHLSHIISFLILNTALLITPFGASAQSWSTVGSAGFSAGQTIRNSIAIDGSGTPYVVYTDYGNSQKATAMKYNGSSWVNVGTAGFSAGTAEYPSIAIDGSGTPYVVYLDGSNSNKATVMKYNGSSWVNVGTADFSAGIAYYTSIAIDGSGTPYVVYRDVSNSDKATVMKYNGSSWVNVGSAGFSAGQADYSSIAIDGSGTPYVVYRDSGNSGKALVMKYNGSSWINVGTAGFSAGIAYYTSIAIDGSGTPYVVYRDDGNSSKATVMKYNGSSWVNVGTAGFSAGQVDYISIATDGSGTPYVVYMDHNDSYKATVMKYNGSSWVNVGTAGFSAGQADYTSIAIDGSGTPYVVYTDYGNSNKATVMKFASPPNTWDGSTSTDWNVASNWSSNAVPTATDNVVIPSVPSNQPYVTLAPGAPAECANLTVESGATLTVNAGKALTTSGATANAGTILVKADATGIGSFIDNGTITGAGSFQMEQYLTGSGGVTPDGLFWYVSSPIANGTSGTYSASGTDKLWSADETTQSYTEITNVTALTVGKGYVARQGAATATRSFSGSSFNTGAQSTSGLSRTGTLETNRGYNLMGNPYPSSVDWEAATRTNLEITCWYRTKNLSSLMTVDTYNATTHVGTNNNGGGAVTRYIPPTQSFWVRVDADGNTGTLGFANADRSHPLVSSIYRMAAIEDLVRVSLSNASYTDEHIVLFDENASELYDEYDSGKLFGGTQPYLYSTVENQDVTMNGVNNPIATPFIDLTIYAPAQGEYNINGVEFTNSDLSVTLEDNLLGTFTDLMANPTYTFTTEEGTFTDRFTLHFSDLLTGLAETNGETIRVYSNSNGINIWLGDETNGNVRIIDMAGRTVHTQNLTSDRTILNHSVSTGVYLVEVTTGTGIFTQKVVMD
jgi:hypothetical protein